jgi:hypothetical protein
MKKLLIGVSSVLLTLGIALAQEFQTPVVFKNTVTFDTGSKTIFKGPQTLSLDRIQAGVDAANYGSTIAGLPKQSFTWMDDFFSIQTSTNQTVSFTSTNIVINTDLLSKWKYAGDGAIVSDFTVGEVVGGILKMTPVATSNNECYLQFGANTTEAFASITSNSAKQLWFEARVAGPFTNQLSTTFIGLAGTNTAVANFIVDTTGILDTNRSYIGFMNSYTYTNKWWNFVIHKADNTVVYTITNVTAGAVSTYKRLGFNYDGVNRLTVYVDGTANAQTYLLNDANYPTATLMSPILGCKTINDTYTPTNLVDYIWIQQDR